MDIASSFPHLNRAQQRALILRDQLRNDEPHQLDKYIEGVTRNEPPSYRRVGNQIEPAFTQVTLKAEATRFDLGNVWFTDETDYIQHAYLTVTNGEYGLDTAEPLEENNDDLFTVPIHSFVAKNMIPLFTGRVGALHARMDKINEARLRAYEAMDQQYQERYTEGKSLAKLDPPVDANEATHRKRGSADSSIVKHPTNKKPRIGLDSIPESVKKQSFEAIPTQVKIDLFDNIVKSAVPSFDNLMTASWNVVSIYLNVGSEYPELHKAVVDLNTVLKEIEAKYGKQRAVKQEPRDDELQSGALSSRIPSGNATPEVSLERASTSGPVDRLPRLGSKSRSIQHEGDTVVNRGPVVDQNGVIAVEEPELLPPTGPRRRTSYQEPQQQQQQGQGAIAVEEPELQPPTSPRRCAAHPQRDHQGVNAVEKPDLPPTAPRRRPPHHQQPQQPQQQQSQQKQKQNQNQHRNHQQQAESPLEEGEILSPPRPRHPPSPHHHHQYQQQRQTPKPASKQIDLSPDDDQDSDSLFLGASRLGAPKQQRSTVAGSNSSMTAMRGGRVGGTRGREGRGGAAPVAPMWPNSWNSSYRRQ